MSGNTVQGAINDDFLSGLVTAPIEEAISTTDLSQALTRRPFLSVPGTFNLRDLAHLPYVRPNLVYRSGTLSGISSEGKDQLIESLQVRTVFDLRSARERKAFPFPDLTTETRGIDVLWFPTDVSPADLDINNFADFASAPIDSWDGGARGFSKDYLQVLTHYKTAFGKVFQHLLDRPGEPILFNCTAGKDRTGTLAALILSLAGVSDDEIAFDYALTRISIEPRKEFLAALIRKWKPEWTPETPGMRGFSNVKAEYMTRFLQDAKAAYAVESSDANWAAQYVETVLGFSTEDIEKIRVSLRA